MRGRNFGDRTARATGLRVRLRNAELENFPPFKETVGVG